MNTTTLPGWAFEPPHLLTDNYDASGNHRADYWRVWATRSSDGEVTCGCADTEEAALALAVENAKKKDQKSPVKVITSAELEAAKISHVDVALINIRALCSKARMPNPPDLGPDWVVIDAERWAAICKLSGCV